MATASDSDLSSLPDDAILSLLTSGKLKPYTLEQHMPAARAVSLRAQHLLPSHEVPHQHYPDYERAARSCCENVVGYVPVPLGLAGPLLMDGTRFNVPIATTEGALVASLSRGCRAVEMRC